MNKSFLALAITLAIATSSAQAATAHNNKQRHNYTVDKTRTSEHGTASRHTVQTKTENGFTRATTRTNPTGQTATRNTVVSNDPASKTRTREVSGTTFDGRTYSGTATTQKTDTGFTRSGTRTEPNGNTSSRDVVATIDKANHQLTKNITTTGPDGQQHTQTVTTQYSKNTAAGSEE